MTSLTVLSLERWDDVWRRNQHLLHRLLRADRDLRVLFVEPPRDPVHALRSRRRPRTGTGVRSIDGYGGRLIAYEATKWLPRSVPFGRGALDAAVGRTLRRLRWTPDLLWVNDPRWAHLASTQDAPVLYDVTDDWVLASRTSRAARAVADDDARLLAHADAIVVCSPALEHAKGGEQEVVLIPNAVDADAYRRDAGRPRDLPERFVALYAGTLHEDRLDVALVAETADRVAETGGALVLVGPDALRPENTALLAHRSNVHLLGPRPHATIPAYLMAADVLIVPHVVTPFTESLDPIKLYEYLASGRPVVSTPVAGFRDRDDIDVRDRTAFAAAVAESRRDAPSQPRTDVPDWDERARRMRKVIDDVLLRGRGGEDAARCYASPARAQDEE